MSFLERSQTATPSTVSTTCSSVSCCSSTPDKNHQGEDPDDFVMVELVEGEVQQSCGKATRRLSCSIPHVRFHTSNAEESVDIAMGESGLAASEPITVAQMMQRTVVRVPHHVALRYKVEGKWNDITYRDYYNQCITAAKSFVKVSHTCM